MKFYFLALISLFSIQAGAASLTVAVDNQLGLIEGNGIVARESRNLDLFSGISCDGPLSVEVVCGQDKHGVEISCDGNLIKCIDTSVQNSILVIGLNKGISSRNAVNVKVYTNKLHLVSALSSGSLRVSDINSDKFSVVATASSQVFLSGSARLCTFKAADAATVDAHRLGTQQAEVTSTGASQVSVNVTRELVTHVSGASAVIYSGDPKIIKNSVNDAGSVLKKQ